MSRSQGAANSGWPPQQRHPAGEPDPRTGGRPAQRAQTSQYPQQGQQYAQPSYGEPQQNGYPAQQPAYQQPAQPQYAQPQYGQAQAGQPGYHYPQQQPAHQPQAPHYPAQQAHAPVPTAPQPNRQALSSLESARNAPQAQTHDFDNFPRTQPPQYGRAPQQQPAQRAQYAAPQPQADNPINAALGYRQPAAQPAAPQYAPQQRTAAPAYDGWPAQQPASDPYGQAVDDYLPADAAYAANGNQPHYDGLQQADWALPAAGYVDPGLADQQAYARGGHYDHQTHGGALEPTYNQDEAAYEAEEPRRRSWTMRIAGAVVVAIGLGYGLAQAYSTLLGGHPSESAPPVIASDSSPAKEKPADPGGRQFSHTDSKVLGRLGEADTSHQDSAGLSESDTGSEGSRQVKTLVVGRDGSIAPPEAEPVNHSEPVSVPGLMVVDAFGSAGQQAAPPQQQPQQRQASAPPRQAEPVADEAPPQRSGMNVKTTKVIPSSTASLPEEAPAAAPPKRQKVAAAAPTNDAGPSGGSAGGANGYVVVLASVPASGTSRLDALRKFADMQQQYGPVLGNKTPDVRETTLAGKGPYHRLLVGPPGSKAQAAELCTQLKAYGYKDCWVTAY